MVEHRCIDAKLKHSHCSKCIIEISHAMMYALQCTYVLVGQWDPPIYEWLLIHKKIHITASVASIHPYLTLLDPCYNSRNRGYKLMRMENGTEWYSICATLVAKQRIHSENIFWMDEWNCTKWVQLVLGLLRRWDTSQLSSSKIFFFFKSVRVRWVVFSLPLNASEVVRWCTEHRTRCIGADLCVAFCNGYY